MAAINQLNVSTAELNNALIRRTIAEFFWSWYLHNSEDIILEKSLIKFISVKIRVHDLKPLFEALFGPMPASVL